jgi:toxin ParE1/3/4
MASVDRSARAEIDLIEIWTGIGRDDPVAADRQLDRIDEACKMLATHPHAGKKRDDLAPDLRFYPVGNYLIFYVPSGNGVAVARIIHAARDYRQEFLD